jgi:hypothetical protein
VVYEGFVQFNDAAEKKKILLTMHLFKFNYLIDHCRHPKQWHYIPQAITPGQTSSPVSTPPHPSISGWLLCVSSSIGGHLRPWCDSSYIFFGGIVYAIINFLVEKQKVIQK